MPTEGSTCCCWKRVKSGSYTCAIYTLILYTALFVAGSWHAHSVLQHPSILWFCLLMVVLSATCVVCSVILLIGLWKDNRYLLLPWTVAVALTTLLDVMLSFYLIRNANTEPFLAVIFVTNVLICAANVYGLLCVLSQYQEYSISQVRQNAIQQSREQIIVQQQPIQLPMTSTANEDATSSPQLHPVPPSISPKNKCELIRCELTIIREETNCPENQNSHINICENR